MKFVHSIIEYIDVYPKFVEIDKMMKKMIMSIASLTACGTWAFAANLNYSCN